MLPASDAPLPLLLGAPSPGHDLQTHTHARTQSLAHTRAAHIRLHSSRLHSLHHLSRPPAFSFDPHLHRGCICIFMSAPPLAPPALCLAFPAFPLHLSTSTRPPPACITPAFAETRTCGRHPFRPPEHPRCPATPYVDALPSPRLPPLSHPSLNLHARVPTRARLSLHAWPEPASSCTQRGTLPRLKPAAWARPPAHPPARARPPMRSGRRPASRARAAASPRRRSRPSLRAASRARPSARRG